MKFPPKSETPAIAFGDIVKQIYAVHESCKQYAVNAINVSITVRNWLIGCYIVEYEQNGSDRAKYGESLLEELAKKIKEKSIKGLDVKTLRICRTLYASYPQMVEVLSQKSLALPDSIRGTVSPKFQNIDYQSVEPLKLVTQLSFSHLSELIKISDPVKRLFYEVEAIKGTWGVRELRRQISTLLYERAGLSKNPEKLLASVQNTHLPVKMDEFIKSPFSFEFLGLQAKDVVYESDLEQAIVDNLQNFLLELGNGFCFEARQKKMLIGEEYFFVDLVFYHRILHCHVLVEIKVDEFKHEHIGQLNVYLEHYKQQVMTKNDNPPVGILLVTNKNNTLVEYAKGSMDNTLFVSKYLLELPNKEELIRIIKEEQK